MMKQQIDIPAVSHELALHILATAIARGDEAGVAVAATVVDPSMNLVGYIRADGVTPHSSETSRRKALTSASTRRATGWMAGELAVALPLGSDNKLTNIKGGVPILFGGVFLGGLGVAGGTPDADLQIALAVLASIGADPVEA
jgi:glc operon protein GlcG